MVRLEGRPLVGEGELQSVVREARERLYRATAAVEALERRGPAALADVEAALGAVAALAGRTGALDGRRQAVRRSAVLMLAALDPVATPFTPSRRGTDATISFARLLELGAERWQDSAGTGPRRWTVERAAAALYVSRRALARRMQRAGLPDACTVLQWGAVLRCAYAFGYENDTATGASLALLGDAHRFSTMMHRTCGLRPVEWKREGASMDALALALVETWQGRAEAVN